MKNLFICLTPLQMRVCQAIIEQENITDYVLICLFLVKNEKYQYYYNLLSKKSYKNIIYYPKDKTIGLNLLWDVYKFIKFIKKSDLELNYDNVYIASIDNRYIQALFSCLSYSNLYTFDDGLANLNYKGSYYCEKKPSKIRRKMWELVGVHLYSEEIRKKSKLHYTIYKNKKNIISNTVFLNMVNSKIKSNSLTNLKIFIGQPICEINPNIQSNYINNILSENNVVNYFPHPREKYKLEEHINIIYSEKIFEDYILDLYKRGEVGFVEIFTFCSTVVLNLNDLDFVKSYIIYQPDLLGEDVYNVFRNFNVNFI